MFVAVKDEETLKQESIIPPASADPLFLLLPPLEVQCNNRLAAINASADIKTETSYDINNSDSTVPEVGQKQQCNNNSPPTLSPKVSCNVKDSTVSPPPPISDVRQTSTEIKLQCNNNNPPTVTSKVLYDDNSSVVPRQNPVEVNNNNNNSSPTAITLDNNKDSAVPKLPPTSDNNKDSAVSLTEVKLQCNNPSKVISDSTRQQCSEQNNPLLVLAAAATTVDPVQVETSNDIKMDISYDACVQTCMNEMEISYIDDNVISETTLQYFDIAIFAPNATCSIRNPITFDNLEMAAVRIMEYLAKT